MTQSTEPPARQEGSGSQPSGPERRPTPGRVRRGYAAAAVVLLNTAVLILVVNVVLGIGYWVAGRLRAPAMAG
jgi:hypothetical protein